MGEFDLLAEFTERFASAERMDEVIRAVHHTIVKLDFAAVWMAVLDEETGNLKTLTEIIEGVDTTHETPTMRALDPRQPIGVSFAERRMISIADPDSLHVLHRDDDPVPPNELGLLRVSHEHLRGHPFACGPLLGSSGEPVGALGLSSYRGNQPIPDSLFSQGLVRAFIDHLGIAMERALHRDKLDAALARAQAAIERDAWLKAVGELAATVAHDLNNLSQIAVAEIDRGLRSPADAANVLPAIERANRAMDKHVARLHRVAKPSSDTETADLHQVIDDVVMLMGSLLREHSIKVDRDNGHRAVPLVRCDFVVVHHVVLNLLFNAKDALGQVPPDRRRIEIRMRDDGGVVRLTVADSGPGIAPEVLAQLFERNYTTKGDTHHGLALASAYKALKPFGGQISARNALDGGAVFEVTLVAAPPGTLAPSPSPPLLVTGKQTRRGRILAVDDDPDIVDVIKANLESVGYEVVTQTDPAQAIAAATSQVFDLVLCDLGMPEHSGLDVCRSLREADYRGKLVLMTGWDPEMVRTDQRECDTLLKKPFEGAALIQMIDKLLGV